MKTRYLLLLLVAPLALALGCFGSPEAPTDGAAPPTGEQPKADAGRGLPVAPEPHTPGEGKLAAPVARAWTDPPSKKPWSELIVGKWLKVDPKPVGQSVWELTKDGKLHWRYSYPAAGGRPAGAEAGTHDYRINGNVLFPTVTSSDGGTTIRQSTTFIESLTENRLVIYAIKRVGWTPETAKEIAIARMMSVEQVLAEVSEERTKGVIYIRLRDKDK